MDFLSYQITQLRTEIDALRAEVEALKAQMREQTKQPEPAAPAASK